MGKHTRDPHFLERDPDGSARVRLTFSAEEADGIDAASGSQAPPDWIKQTLVTRARYHIRRRREQRER